MKTKILFRFGLRTRLVLLVILCALPAVAATLWEGQQSLMVARQNAHHDALQFARLSAEEQQRMIAAAHSLLAVLATSPQIDLKHPAQCTRFLTQQLSQQPQLNNIGVTDANGIVRCSAVVPKGRVSLADRPYIHNALTKKVFSLSQLQTGRITQTGILSMATPVFDLHGHLVAAVYLSMPLSSLQRELNQAGLPAGTTVNLIDAKAQVLAHYPLTKDWQQRHTLTPALQRAVLTQNFEGTTEVIKTTSGYHRLFAFAPIRGMAAGQLAVVVGIRADVAYANARHILHDNLMRIGFAILVMILLAFWGGRVFILRPLLLLKRAARQLGEGNLRARAPVGSNHSEFYDLAVTFNDMAATIERNAEEQESTTRKLVSQIEERRRVETALRQSESRYRSVMASLKEVIFQADRDGRWTFLNPAWSEISGFSVNDSLHKPLFHFTHPGDRANIQQLLDAVLLRERDYFQCELRLLAADGSVRWLEANARALIGTDSTVTGVSGTLVDTTERKLSDRMLEDSQQRLDLAMDAASMGAWEWDFDNLRLWCSAATMNMLTGDPTAPAIEDQQDFLQKLHPEDRQAFTETLRRALETGAMQHIECRVCWPEGEIRHLALRGAVQKDISGYRKKMVGVALDVTAQKEQERRLARLAQYDSLTGLPNRNLFLDRLEQAHLRAKRGQNRFALLFMDLDRFKEVNDHLGHHAGDVVLVAAAERIRSCVRDTDTLARLSGDEFTVILEGIHEASSVEQVAQKIIDAFAPPFVVEGKEFFLSTSLGAVIYPDNDRTPEGLLKKADMAMYQAKAAGRNNFQFFSWETEQVAEERLNLKNQLRHALERNEFYLVYQPQRTVAGGPITGVEALIRWRHPDLGLVSPDRFIPIAEETGLIIPIGRWVLKTACEQNVAWQRAGYPAVRIAVNLSPRQLRDTGLASMIEQTVVDSGMEINRLSIEITEGLLVENIQLGRTVLDTLRRIGVKVALDDFGTGYSSLAYLKDLPLDTLKMDGAFVRNLATQEEDKVIARSIVNLAHRLRLEVVAEGVETEEQLYHLAEIGCDLVQGYLFSPPVTADLVERQFQEQSLVGLDD